MRLILTAVVLIGFYGELSNGKHQEINEKTNKLARFFQDNNSSEPVLESSNKNKYRMKFHLPLMNNSTKEKSRDQGNKLPKTISYEGEKENYQDSKKHLSEIKIFTEEKENKPRNETKDSSTTANEIHKAHHEETSEDKKKQNAEIRQLLCTLFNVSNESEACKDKHHSKKAMIWPTRMIPWLKKVLIGKLSRGVNNHMPFLDDMEGTTESPFGGGTQNSLSDNWDSDPLLNMRRKHHHGLKMVPLLKSLKAKLYGHGAPGYFGSLNDALNGEGLNGFGPMPTQGSSKLIRQVLGQALGSSDRNSVLNEMMQEFLLANNREETEGNGGFADLAERNSFSQLNNGLQSSPVLPEPNLGGVNMLQGNMRASLASEQPIHAQMLDNGAIAPMTSQQIGDSPLKGTSFLGGRSPIGRSPMVGSPFRMPSSIFRTLSSPTSRSPQFQSSVLEAPQREGSLLQRAGGFDTPISSSVLQRTANPTQRMYTETEGEEQGISSQEDNFIERNEAGERRLPLRQSVGNNMVMEEMSDNQAREGHLPMQTNPDLNRLLKLQANYRSPESPSISKVSRLELDSNVGHGLRLPIGSNTMGMASVLSKVEDSINFNDLGNDRSLAFRRGKVLKRVNSSHIPSKKPTTTHDSKPKTKKSGG